MATVPTSFVYGVIMISNELLAQVRKAQKRANNKAYRLRKAGVNLPKELDPREDISKIARSSESYARSYIADLAHFSSRETSYVAGYQGRPLSGPLYRQYKSLERTYNRLAEARYNGLADTRLPWDSVKFDGSKQTIREADQIGGRTMIFATGERATERLNRLKFPSDRHLLRSIEDISRRIKMQRGNEYATGIRGVINKALKDVGETSSLGAIVSGLTDRQLEILWEPATRFATLFFNYYRILQAHRDGDENSPLYHVAEDTFNDSLNDIVTWARKLPTEKPTNSTSRGRNGRSKIR